MIKFIKIWMVVFLCGTMYLSCQQQKAMPSNYPQDPTISAPSGEPKDSLTYYVPTTIRKDTQTVKLDIDNLSLDHFSTGLFYSKEPILYNYYLGHDVYRFSLLRAFYTPIYFILHKDGNKVWLTTKGLDRRPNISPPPKKFVGNWKTGDWVQDMKDEYGDTILQNSHGTYTRRANLIYNTTIQLTQKEWDEFEALINGSSFWNMEPFDTEGRLDSERWLMEAHLRDKYWFVSLYGPKGGFQKAGNFLMEKSGIMNDPIYTTKK